ncbi:HAD family hydrolase [Vannielia litorea]|uniref:phosphoglycolate phosphatase n=1 Tax=Vannielia litorea TaxID=1217970 RepID=A0A1N6H2D2_9RHOB|nr:HAD-IA family hydrolase [Vannielia litorea]SIO13835.1 haloacid dehalogenase superfamily, subfamily IA, variant 3 with third motif having DD or ED [Vannielia litorea]
MTLELVIFDCDGVLVDSEGPLSELVVADLATRGFVVSAEDFHDRFTGGTMKDVDRRLREAGAALPEGWVPFIYERIFARMAAGVEMTEGAVALIDWLEARGVAVAVASNGPMQKMRGSLGPSGLLERLGARVFSAHDHGTAKPEPGLLLLAAEAAGVAPARAVMVDDSPVGHWAARDAGMGFFGYVEHGNAAKMEAEGVALVHSMAGLRARLEEMLDG